MSAEFIEGTAPLDLSKCEMPPKPARKPGTFPKGVSGNPAGRPKGARNKLSIIRDKLETDLGEAADQILAKSIELANAGDTTMLRCLLDRLLPKEAVSGGKGKEKIRIEINNLTDKPPAISINGESEEDL